MGQQQETDDIRKQLSRLQRTVSELERRNRTVSDRNSNLETELHKLQTMMEKSETTESGTDSWYGEDTPLGNEISVVRGGINEF
ncbi:MAG: hypothetical protein JXQ27_09660 [Acidobacteria bacterium]|nr:hypothetical protein [Acidobacteriota bacterium]